jgi:hypothetical protein
LRIKLAVIADDELDNRVIVLVDDIQIGVVRGDSTSISPALLVPAALALETKTKSTVRLPQAVTSPATSRLAAETSISWLDLLNFMRIFRQRAGI